MEDQQPLFSKKTIINLVFLGIIVLGLPVGIQLVQSQKIFRSFAAQESIKFITDGVNVIDRGSRQVAIKPTVTLEITSKDGLPSSQASLPTSIALNYSPIDKAYARAATEEGGGSCGVDPVDEQCYCDKAVADWCNCEGNCATSKYQYPTPEYQSPSYGTPYAPPVQEQPKQEQPQQKPASEGGAQGGQTCPNLVDHFAGCNTDTLEECDVYKDSCTGAWPVYKNCNKTPGKCGVAEVSASLAASAEDAEVDKDAECRAKPPEYYCDNATEFEDGLPKCIEKQLGWDGVASDCIGAKYTEVPASEYCPSTTCTSLDEITPAPRKLLAQAESAATKKAEAGGRVERVQPSDVAPKPSPSPSPTAKPSAEKCYVCDNNKWRLNGGTGACSANVSRTCQAGKDVNQVCKSAQDLKDVNCISTRAYTLSLRVAENPLDLSSAPSVDYTSEPMRVSYTFADPKPGKKFIYVQFSLSDGRRVSATPVSINLSQPDAQVASLTCSLDPSGQGIKITFKGENFGGKEGRVNVDGSIPLRILSWSDKVVVALSQDTSIRSKQDLLQATLTRNDGEKVDEKCGVGISLISLGAKLFCRAPSQHSQDNVEVEIVEVIENTIGATGSKGARKVKERVKIDKEGVLQGIKTKLEDGKVYKVALKAPKALKRILTFTASDGTTTIPQTILPIGDIYPRDGGDGKINSLDAAELRRQWGKVSTASKNCDFNQDGVCNSFEWACMKYDFNKEDDTEL